MSEIVPVTLREARGFVAAHHRHNEPPQGWKFGVGLRRDGELRAVGVAGQPIARALNDGFTVEITRVCTIGDKNAASQIYGALCRAAAALGYRRVVTYTLASERGSSLLASGFTRDGLNKHHAHKHTGDTLLRSQDMPRLFDAPKMPDEDKVRWIRTFGPSAMTAQRTK